MTTTENLIEMLGAEALSETQMGEVYRDFMAVRNAVDAIEDRGTWSRDVNVDTILGLVRTSRPGVMRQDVLLWLRFLVAAGRLTPARPDGVFGIAVDEHGDTAAGRTRAELAAYNIPGAVDFDDDIEDQDPPEVAALADELGTTYYDSPVPYLPADDPITGELHRRTTDAVGNIRAADTKASVLLAVLGSPPRRSAPSTTRSRSPQSARSSPSRPSSWAWS